jgi:esterase/lipase superfamily enzyme
MLLYIHGFNTSFDSAAMRTAQVAFDLRFRGPAAFFSWPSKGNLWSYAADLRDADASVDLLADFMVDIATKTDVEKIHVIAHSMGNRILGLALENIRNRKLRVQLGELVLAAPDLDGNLFGRLARVYPALAVGTTMYVSRRDQALALSGRLWAGPRVGFAPPVTVERGIDTIDVRSLDLSLLGHGYVSALSPVLSDIEAILRGRRPPGDRMRVSASRDGRHWILR